MELITILNRCHRFRGFVYKHAISAPTRTVSKWSSDRARVRRQFARAAHLLAPGYHQLAERRFELIPLWGFLVFFL
jgi:transposase